ncbi:hypothetical protein EsVE80_00880 [Enterococcus saigonensis]|uniref:PTS EIIA type-4 domain-containing protein n=1 Tax=Enterococcus saigonensis TaxID=1805431 RepID=A0A679IH76_9ENTE|nr:PTS sugar transporter subunit IIA [Enterococcus saigonensis]BCA84565.1 hypothetical protein EsVE80_00880 [Enterococcus saigonensis]
MTKILITGHGNFASGLVSNLSLIAGENSELIALDYNGMDSLENFSEKMNQKVSQLGERVFILTDIKGGTPFNVAYHLKASNPDNILLFAGVNTPVVLEILVHNFDGKSEEEVYQQLQRPELFLTRAEFKNIVDIEDEID